MPDVLPSTLQEAVLALLCFDDRFGALAAAQVQPAHFDDRYRALVSAVLRYRNKYSRAPGKAQLTDLVHAAARSDKGEALQDLRRIARTLAVEAEGLNAEYVASRVGDFIRQQFLQSALIEAGDRFTQGGDGFVDDVERILHQALRFRAETLDAGLMLNEARALDFLNRERNSYRLDIKELDRLEIGPAPKQLVLYIAPKGSGKSWFCVHVGRQAIKHRLRVLHVTLEMDEPLVAERYFMSLFSLASHPDSFQRPRLQFTDGELSGFELEWLEPRAIPATKEQWKELRKRDRSPIFHMKDPRFKNHLRELIKPWGTRLGRLVIKRFPTGMLTVEQLASYLDFLDSAHKFVPDIMIVDYPDLMKIDTNNYRHSLAGIFPALRGIGVLRNMAVVCPTQGGRTGLQARQVESHMVSEDIGKVHTSDVVFTFSRTEAEKRLNLGRLKVAHARGQQDNIQLLLAQSYHTGQYVIGSARMQQAYWDRLRQVTGEEGANDDD